MRTKAKMNTNEIIAIFVGALICVWLMRGEKKK